MASVVDTHELLVQSVVDYAIYMLDPNGRVVSWNAGAERIKGYRGHEIIGEHFSRFYMDEDQAAGLPAEALKIAGLASEKWRAPDALRGVFWP